MHLKVKPIARPEQVIQVSDDAVVSDIMLASKKAFGVDPANQRLVFKGCPLLDLSKEASRYGIRDGDKLTLIIKTSNQELQKPSFDALLRAYLSKSYSEADVELIVSKFMHLLSDRINSMSLDDIERLAEVWMQAD